MQFNENKFEQISHGNINNIGKGIYKTKSGQMIKEDKTTKDLGILQKKKSGHIDDIVLSSKINAGLLLRKFKTREAESMMKMFNSFNGSKLDYYCLIRGGGAFNRLFGISSIPTCYLEPQV